MATSHVHERSATRRRSKRSSHRSTQRAPAERQEPQERRSDRRPQEPAQRGHPQEPAELREPQELAQAKPSEPQPFQRLERWPELHAAAAPAASPACLCRVAFVAAGYQRRGRNVWAQCHSDPAQPSPSSNYSDVESIKDRHRHRLLHSRKDIPHPSDAQNRMSYRSRGWTTSSIISSQSSSTRHAAPHRFQTVTFGIGLTPVSRASVLNLRLTDPRGFEPRRFWWWSRLVSNQRPSACEADALPLSYETREVDRTGRTRSKISTRRAARPESARTPLRAHTAG